MTAEQLRMARALLRISVRDLAREAGLNPGTIINLEGGSKGQVATLARLRETLQAKGVVFIGSLEPFHGPGVALRWDMEPPEAVEHDPGDEREAEQGNGSGAQPWDEAETRLSSDEIEDMRRHWAEPGRWERISEPSRKALMRVIGHMTVTDAHH